MTVSSIIILPLGCILFVGLAICLAWGIKSMMPHINPVDSSFASLDENQVVSLSKGMQTKNFKMYLPYLLSPLAQAFIVYLASILLILPMSNGLDISTLFLFAVIFMFTGFSAISPIVNLFLPRWWLNAILFVISWFLLFSGLMSTMMWRLGDAADMTGLGMAFALPIIAAGCVFPLTALIRLIMYVIKNRENTSLPS